MNSQDNTFKKFLIVWGGQLISAIGSGLTAFALGVFVYQKTQSATSYSLVILFAFLPSFVLLPFGGVLADRFDRKKMMMLGDAGAMLGLIFILVIMVLGKLELWHIYIGVLGSAMFSAIQGPAYKSAVTDMVSEKLYSQASGLIQLASSAQYLISPIIAGFLLRIFDIKLVLIIDILTFVIAVAAVFLIKQQSAHQQKPEEQKFFQEMSQAFHYLLTQKGILWLVILTSIVSFYIGFLQSLIGPMMLAITDSNTFGLVLSISASGMLITSLFIGAVGLKQSKVFTFSLSLMFAGLFYAFIGLFPSVILMTIFGFLFFCTLPFVNTSLEVLIRTNVENKKQGRVWSLASAISQLGYIVAFGSAGLLADHIFNPLLYSNGVLARTVGRIIGTGPGRGIGFMFIISGLLVSVVAVVIGQVKRIKELEVKRNL